MENTEKKEKKEVVIIPEVEPNQKSITQTYNDIIFIVKAVLITALIMLIYTFITSILR